FTKDNAIQYGPSWVCAACKPVFVQRLREGAPLPRPAASAIGEEELLARDYRVEIADCLERAWKVFAGNAGLILGTSLVAFLLFLAGWLVSVSIALVIPFANALFSLIYTGPLVGGYLWFWLRLARGEPATVG